MTVVDKSKARFDLTAEELERVLVQKEGESMKDTAMQARSPGGVGGKRALGKAVAKGGMLLIKGKNPGNVCCLYGVVSCRVSSCRLPGMVFSYRSIARKMMSELGCLRPPMFTRRRLRTPPLFGKSTSTSSCHDSYAYVQYLELSSI